MFAGGDKAVSVGIGVLCCLAVVLVVFVIALFSFLAWNFSKGDASDKKVKEHKEINITERRHSTTMNPPTPGTALPKEYYHDTEIAEIDEMEPEDINKPTDPSSEYYKYYDYV